MDLQVRREFCVPTKIRDDAERSGGDHHRYDRQAIEAVREIDGVSGARNHKDRQENEANAETDRPAHIERQILEEWECELVGKFGRRKLHDEVAGDGRDQNLKRYARTAGEPVARAFRYLQEIIVEPDHAVRQRDADNDPDVSVFKLPP